MKRLLFLLMFILCFAGAVVAQGQVYQCVRPDGSVVCTVRNTSGDPSVSCNHDCVECNMVCAARLLLQEEGGGAMTPVPPPPVRGERTQPQPGGQAETPAYCAQKYQECKANCRSDPANRGAYELNACLSSCESWRSGCGTWNRSRDGN